MDPRSLTFIAQGCDGDLLKGTPETQVRGICTDSRRVKSGELFFALAGENFDGHDFIAEAAKKGVAVVLQRDRLDVRLPECGVIAVDDTRKALGRLAVRYRNDFSLPVIAVAGSNGKTTTKELIASVLKQKLGILWSEASFNNDIGVPLTLLRLQRAQQAAVLEAGTNHPGELEPLVRMIQPTHGVLTSIGREHLEFFGDLEGVAREEGWLAELLPQGGKLFINGDSEWTRPIAQRCPALVVRAGLNNDNDWRLLNIRPDKHGSTFKVAGPLAQFCGEYRIHLLGRHQALNALFAICLGAELGLGREEIQRGLETCKPAKMRMQLWELNGVRVLDDAYNANADSMLAALQTLQEFPCKGRKLAVLGDMGELGVHSEAAHEEVGRHAAELGVGQLFAVGKMAPVMARGARNAGLNRVLEFADVAAAALAVKQFIRDGDLLLLKASRATCLEQIAEQLRGAGARKN